MKRFLLTFMLGTFPLTAIAQIENAVFAIVKISYNQTGESPVVGGICGSAFLIDDTTAITAHHVLNSQVGPNAGYRHCQFWLLSRNNSVALPIETSYLDDHKEIDATIIHLQAPLTNFPQLTVEKRAIKAQTEVYNIGHVGEVMPIKEAQWENNNLIIKSYSLDGHHADYHGQILEIKELSVAANDVNIANVEVVRPSFGAILGMSGGPLIDKKTNTLVGLMSFGLPADSSRKEIVFAISANELFDKLHR